MKPFFALGVAAFVLVSLMAPASALADTCECFCHSSGGAVSISTSTASIDECRISCDAQDLRLLGCYTDTQEDSLPENNQLCWTEAECLSDEVPIEVDESGAILQVAPSVWGGQESFCPEREGYCYNPPGAVSEYGGKTTVTLGIPIGDLDEPGDIAEYVEAIYTFLISASAILAVFVLMVGGVQYALAAGNTGRAAAAKQRMSAALLGLSLVLGAYVIARIIDPRLVDFNFFAVPKVRTIIFLDPSSGCEAIMDQGIEVIAAPNEMECGFKGIVGDVSEATGGNLSIGIEEGDECQFTLCPDALESCVQSSASDTGFACVRCSDIHDDSDNGIEPDELRCSQALSEDLADRAEREGDYAACAYHNAGVGDEQFYDSCVEIYYPQVENQNVLDCDQLRADARDEGAESCRMYDLVWGRLYGEFVDRSELDWLQENNNDFSIFEGVCQDDPCGVAPPGQGCSMYLGEPTGGWCQLPFLSETPLCQVVADLAFVASCYDTAYMNDWNEIVRIWEEDGLSGSFDMLAIWEDLYPLDVDGDIISPDPSW